jgi:hypothetical protein
MGGMMISFTREVTIAPKATPIMIPMARSITFPRIANALNSAIKLIPGVLPIPMMMGLSGRA